MMVHIARVFEYVMPQGDPSFGGISAAEFFLCRELARLGHQVTLFTSDIPPGRYSKTSEMRHCADTSVEPRFQIKRSLAIANFGGDMPIMPLLGKRMGSVDADVIHAHESYNHSSFVSWRAAKSSRVPFTYSQERYYWVKRRIWQPFFSVANKTLLGSVRNSPRFVVAFSKAAADFLSNQGYPRSRILIIPLGVDSDVFAPRSGGWFRKSIGIGDDPLILTVARLHRSKNLESLIRALAYVHKSVSHAKLVIAGGGILLNRMRVLISSLGLEGKVILYTEKIPYEKMPVLYNESNLLVLPSFYEPFGLAVVEAMACAKPAGVSDVGGMSDTVVDGKTGFRIAVSESPTFVKSLASKISLLLSDSTLAKAMGEEARRRVQRYYDVRVVAHRYDEFYRTLTE